MSNLFTKTCLAIVCLTLLETIALLKGVNGTMFGAIVAAIGGLGGFTIGKYVTTKQKAKEDKANDTHKGI